MKVLVVEDDVRLHGVIREILQGEAYSLGFVTSVEQARAMLRSESFSSLLVDLGLPDGSGIDLIREASASARCLVVTSAATRAHVLGALRAGACGYLLKDELAERLVIALREMLAGGMPISPEAAAFVLERFRAEAPSAEARPPTPKERETLQLLARGFTYAQIAASLGVSINTVRSHVSSAYGKLQASNMAEAVMLALREGWIER